MGKGVGHSGKEETVSWIKWEVELHGIRLIEDRKGHHAISTSLARLHLQSYTEV